MEEIKDFYIPFYRLGVKDIWELITKYALTYCSMDGSRCSHTDKHFTVSFVDDLEGITFSFSNLPPRYRTLIINESTLTQFQLMGTKVRGFVPNDGI